ncbi:MAG TPA: SCP2 sterol-binding domain-containing protein [Pilimelia sp.]|nr:SCP2 sterol-binding domain-containing protein [Pilimelia sp.]
MSDEATRFFRELGGCGYEPTLRRATGTIRFDLNGNERAAPWLVTIERGQVGVARRKGAADCVVRADQELFGRLVAGTANMMTMLLRGRITVVQDKPELLVLFQRFMRVRQHRAAHEPAAATAGPTTKERL